MTIRVSVNAAGDRFWWDHTQTIPTDHVAICDANQVETVVVGSIFKAKQEGGWSSDFDVNAKINNLLTHRDDFITDPVFVSTTPDGKKSWWLERSAIPREDQVRDATAEERAVVNRIVWCNAAFLDNEGIQQVDPALLANIQDVFAPLA